MRLTPRQREVLPLLVQGLSNRSIGHRLSISESTVKTHVRRIGLAMGIEWRPGANMRAEIMQRAHRSIIAADLPRYDPRTEVVVPRDVWEQLQRLVSLVGEAA